METQFPNFFQHYWTMASVCEIWVNIYPQILNNIYLFKNIWVLRWEICSILFYFAAFASPQYLEFCIIPFHIVYFCPIENFFHFILCVHYIFFLFQIYYEFGIVNILWNWHKITHSNQFLPKSETRQIPKSIYWGWFYKHETTFLTSNIYLFT